MASSMGFRFRRWGRVACLAIALSAGAVAAQKGKGDLDPQRLRRLFDPDAIGVEARLQGEYEGKLGDRRGAKPNDHALPADVGQTDEAGSWQELSDHGQGLERPRERQGAGIAPIGKDAPGEGGGSDLLGGTGRGGPAVRVGGRGQPAASESKKRAQTVQCLGGTAPGTSSS
jgi:hypothetical protein